MVIIKKYSNRRLYATDESRYITLDELAQKVRQGADVQVIDAKSGTDLTQATLTQIVIESRGAARMLPVELLTQFIRMGDDALADFFKHYLSRALHMYNQARTRTRQLADYYPLASVPLAASDAFARLFGQGFQPPPQGFPQGYAPGYQQPPVYAPPPEMAPVAPEMPDPSASESAPPTHASDAGGAASAADVAALRSEIEALKGLLSNVVVSQKGSDS